MLVLADQHDGPAIRSVLENDGFVVDVTEDPDEALARVAYCHPDLVVVGLGLPELGGFDVVAHLCPARRVPVIALAGSPCGARRVLAMQLGVADCFDRHRVVEELVPRARAVLAGI